MRSTHSRPRQMLLATTLFTLMAAALPPAVAAQPIGADVSPVFATQLPNVPGKSLTAVVVRYAPGAASPPHHHAGSVFVYVLSGVIRSQVTPGGPAKDYKPGETFSSHQAAITSLVRMPAPRSQRACSRSSSRKTAPS